MTESQNRLKYTALGIGVLIGAAVLYVGVGFISGDFGWISSADTAFKPTPVPRPEPTPTPTPTPGQTVIIEINELHGMAVADPDCVPNLDQGDFLVFENLTSKTVTVTFPPGYLREWKQFDLAPHKQPGHVQSKKLVKPPEEGDCVYSVMFKDEPNTESSPRIVIRSSCTTSSDS